MVELQLTGIKATTLVTRPGNSGGAWESRSQKQYRDDRNFWTKFKLFVKKNYIVAIYAIIFGFCYWFYSHPLENQVLNC